MSLPIGVTTSMDGPTDCLRNRVAGRLANAVLLLATERYRQFVEGAIAYGMDAAARDVLDGRDPPAAWFHEEGAP